MALSLYHVQALSDDQHLEDQEMQELDNNNENHLKRTSSEGNESPSSGVRFKCRFRVS